MDEPLWNLLPPWEKESPKNRKLRREWERMHERIFELEKALGMNNENDYVVLPWVNLDIGGYY
jgi:hypothetical protein